MLSKSLMPNWLPTPYVMRCPSSLLSTARLPQWRSSLRLLRLWRSLVGSRLRTCSMVSCPMSTTVRRLTLASWRSRCSMIHPLPLVSLTTCLHHVTCTNRSLHWTMPCLTTHGWRVSVALARPSSLPSWHPASDVGCSELTSMRLSSVLTSSVLTVSRMAVSYGKRVSSPKRSSTQGLSS